jgi:hypothetical protein
MLEAVGDDRVVRQLPGERAGVGVIRVEDRHALRMQVVEDAPFRGRVVLDAAMIIKVVGG